MNHDSTLSSQIKKNTLHKEILKDKNIFITGASDGIGKATALRCAELGATTILLGKTESKLDSVYDEITNKGLPQPAIIPFDLTESDEALYKQVSDYVNNEFGSLDGLILSAGLLGEIAPLAQYKASTFAKVMQVNVNSQFLLCKNLLPSLENANSSSVAFLSSTVGRSTRAYWGAYSISKFAVEGMMQLWATELENASSIRINSLNPGATRTSMRQKAYPMEDPKSVKSADSVADALAFLMSDKSKDINGQQLNV